jgi:type VI secretion system secreted protein Hcp
MAVDMFLKLDGIDGESLDKSHAKWIDIQSFSWGVSQTGGGHRGGGSGAGKVDVSDVTITKYVDKASATLFLDCCNGKHIAKGSLIVRKAGENPLEYLKYDFENILVSNVQASHASAGDIPMEQVSLNFAKIKFEYWTQNEKGAKGENANFSWDVAQNVKY